MTNTYKSHNRRKYLLQYHLIFVCKYRKKLLVSKEVSDLIKSLSIEICEKHNVLIRYMETDKDHILNMIATNPNIRPSDLVRTMKSYLTFHIWKKYPVWLRKHFWKENTFWSDGYFIASLGNVSESVIKEYIENQGH